MWSKVSVCESARERGRTDALSMATTASARLSRHPATPFKAEEDAAAPETGLGWTSSSAVRAGSLPSTLPAFRARFFCRAVSCAATATVLLSAAASAAKSHPAALATGHPPLLSGASERERGRRNGRQIKKKMSNFTRMRKLRSPAVSSTRQAGAGEWGAIFGGLSGAQRA